MAPPARLAYSPGRAPPRSCRRRVEVEQSEGGSGPARHPRRRRRPSRPVAVAGREQWPACNVRHGAEGAKTPDHSLSAADQRCARAHSHPEGLKSKRALGIGPPVVCTRSPPGAPATNWSHCCASAELASTLSALSMTKAISPLAPGPIRYPNGTCRAESRPRRRRPSRRIASSIWRFNHGCSRWFHKCP